MHWLIQSMPVLCESLVTPCQLRPPPLLKERVHNYNSEWELVNIVRSTQTGPGGGWEKEGATHSSQASRGSSLEGLMGAVGCGLVARKTDSRYLHTARFLAVMIRRAASKWSCPAESIGQQSIVVTQQLGFGLRQACVHIPVPSLIIFVNISEPQGCLRACALKSFLFHHLLVV